MKCPTQTENFHTVTLSIPPPQKLLDIQPVNHESLLDHYIAQDVVMDSDTSRFLIRQTSIAKLPQCLCLHVQRTGYQGGRAFKKEDYVRVSAGVQRKNLN